MKKEYDFYKCLQALVKEHFELVKEYNTLLSRYNALNHQQAYKFEELEKGSVEINEKNYDQNI